MNIYLNAERELQQIFWKIKVFENLLDSTIYREEEEAEGSSSESP